MALNNETRRISSKRLREWALTKPTEGEAVKEIVDVGYALDTINKMFKGTYNRAPRPSMRLNLCQVTGLSEDILFPVVRAIGKKSKSA